MCWDFTSLPSRLQPDSFLCSPSLLVLKACSVLPFHAADLCFVLLHLGALPCLPPCSCWPCEQVPGTSWGQLLPHPPCVTAWGVRKAAFGMGFDGDGNGPTALPEGHYSPGLPCPS